MVWSGNVRRVCRARGVDRRLVVVEEGENHVNPFFVEVMTIIIHKKLNSVACL